MDFKADSSIYGYGRFRCLYLYEGYISNAIDLADDVKDIFESLLDVPQDPMRAGNTVYARSFGPAAPASSDALPLKLPAHARGGIFNIRHIAEIAEKGAEAVVPLDRSDNGRRIWERAGLLGGYFAEKAKAEDAETPAVTKAPSSRLARAAVQRLSGGGGGNVTVYFTQENHFTGKPDAATVQKIRDAGQAASVDMERFLNEHDRHARRVAYS